MLILEKVRTLLTETFSCHCKTYSIWSRMNFIHFRCSRYEDTKLLVNHFQCSEFIRKWRNEINSIIENMNIFEFKFLLRWLRFFSNLKFWKYAHFLQVLFTSRLSKNNHFTQFVFSLFTGDYLLQRKNDSLVEKKRLSYKSTYSVYFAKRVFLPFTIAIANSVSVSLFRMLSLNFTKNYTSSTLWPLSMHMVVRFFPANKLKSTNPSINFQ